MSVAGATDSDPVQWSTSQVMEWMTNFTDSKEAIKQKILSIVRDNDLDGLALKQLRDDSEELHELLPVLKERLTFKAMMKKLLGPSGVTKQTVVSSVPLISQSSQPFKASVAPQSPTQSPSTSLESPPPPTLTRQQAPPLPPVASPSKNVFIGDQHPTAVLPAFSSFVSSRGVPSTSSPLIASAHGCTSTQFERSGNGHRSGQDENYHAIYPTGIISDAYSKRIPTTQTPIYQGQVTVSSPTSNPSSSYDLTFTYSDPRIQTSASSQASSLSDQSCTTEMAPASSRSNNMKLKMGHWASSRGMRYTKAHEITQKYKKILQRVRLTAESDREQIHFPAPLPTFSPILQQQIDRGNILSFKTRFVYECAQFYMSINPTPTHTAYRNISMTIVAKFPELADHSNDREPWRPFNTSLSQAIRNIRRRLRSVPGTGFPPAAPRYQHIQGRDVSNMTGNMSGMNMHQANNDLPHPKAMNRHQRGSPSTSDISESVNDSDDPIECVEIPEEPSNRGDNESGEVQDVVIKTEDLPDNEEEIIPVEWSNDDNN